MLVHRQVARTADTMLLIFFNLNSPVLIDKPAVFEKFFNVRALCLVDNRL